MEGRGGWLGGLGGGIVRLETQKESKKAFVFDKKVVWACTRGIFFSCLVTAQPKKQVAHFDLLM